MRNMKNLEIKTIEHKGIKITIKIDYDKGEASIVEWIENSSKYDPKQWIFKSRGLEYMKGWETIAEAITVAIKECKKELEFSLAQSSKFSKEQLAAFEDELIKNAALVKAKKK